MQYTLRWQRLGDGSIICTDGRLWDPADEIEDWFTEDYWKAIASEEL
jgi:hypothetical protein